MEKKYLIVVHRNDKRMNDTIVCYNQQEAEDLHKHWFDVMEQQDPNKSFGVHDGELLLNKDRNGFITAVELAEVKTLSLLKREE